MTAAVETWRDSGCVLVEPVGFFDVPLAQEVDALVAQSFAPERCVVALAETTGFDARAFTVLAYAAVRARSHGGALVVVGVPVGAEVAVRAAALVTADCIESAVKLLTDIR